MLTANAWLTIRRVPIVHHLRSLTGGTVKRLYDQHRRSCPGRDVQDPASPLVGIDQGGLRKSTNLGHYPLIVAFCDSRAYQEDSFSILHVLEKSVRRLPGITCFVCEKFLTRFSDEATYIRTHRAGDIHMVVKLLFLTYHQHQNEVFRDQDR